MRCSRFTRGDVVGVELVVGVVSIGVLVLVGERGNCSSSCLRRSMGRCRCSSSGGMCCRRRSAGRSVSAGSG